MQDWIVLVDGSIVRKFRTHKKPSDERGEIIAVDDVDSWSIGDTY